MTRTEAIAVLVTGAAVTNLTRNPDGYINFEDPEAVDLDNPDVLAAIGDPDDVFELYFPNPNPRGSLAWAMFELDANRSVRSDSCYTDRSLLLDGDSDTTDELVALMDSDDTEQDQPFTRAMISATDWRRVS